MTHCRRCGVETPDHWPTAPLCPRCEGRSGAMPCGQCGEPLIEAPELDEPFDEETFGGEGLWQAFRCQNGHVKYDPLD